MMHFTIISYYTSEGRERGEREKEREGERKREGEKEIFTPGFVLDDSVRLTGG